MLQAQVDAMRASNAELNARLRDNQSAATAGMGMAVGSEEQGEGDDEAIHATGHAAQVEGAQGEGGGGGQAEAEAAATGGGSDGEDVAAEQNKDKGKGEEEGWMSPHEVVELVEHVRWVLYKLLLANLNYC